jgi:hypothetical protein
VPIDDKDISILPGDLNNVKRKKFRRRMTRDPARGVNAARVSAVRTLYEDDLDLNGTFRGIILKEVPENYEATSWIGDVVDFLGDAFFDQIKYYKVRVPEVHAYIPDPWSSDVDNECTLLLHPTFQTIKGQEEKYEPGQIVTVRFYSADGVYQPTILEDFGKKATLPTKPIDRSSDVFVQALLENASGVNPVFGDSIGTGQKLDPITKLPTSNSPDSVKRGWRSKFGGAKWRIDLDGIVLQNLGRPFVVDNNIENLWRDYGVPLLRASSHFQVPVDILVALIPDLVPLKNGRYDSNYISFEAVSRQPDVEAEQHWRRFSNKVREADAGRYLPNRVSVGLMQNKVSIAREIVKKYQQLFRIRPYDITSPAVSLNSNLAKKEISYKPEFSSGISDRPSTSPSSNGIPAQYQAFIADYREFLDRLMPPHQNRESYGVTEQYLRRVRPNERILSWTKQGHAAEARRRANEIIRNRTSGWRTPITAEQYPDILFSCFIDIESDGKAHARRKTNGVLAEYCGLLQIGINNAADLDKTNVFFLAEPGEGSARQGDDPIEVGIDSMVHFILYTLQGRRPQLHNFNPFLMAAGWKSGFGIIPNFLNLRDSNASAEKQIEYLRDKYEAHKYVAQMARALELHAPYFQGSASAAEKFSLVKVPADEPPQGYGINSGLQNWSVRSDIADSLRKIKDEVNQAGGKLISAGGLRKLTANVSSTRSAVSIHYSGLAVDLSTSQGMQNPKKDPYVITEDPTEEGKWIVYARTTSGDTKVIEKAVKHRAGQIEYVSVTDKFINLTDLFKREGFEPISARSEFPEKYLAAEWWHFEKVSSFVKGETTFGDMLLTIYEESEVSGTEPWKYRSYIWNGERFSEGGQGSSSKGVSKASTLSNPEVSIFCAAGYIRTLMEREGPEPILILASYNQGYISQASNSWRIAGLSDDRVRKYAGAYNTFHKLVQEGVITLPARTNLSIIAENQDITGVNVDITSE